MKTPIRFSLLSWAFHPSALLDDASGVSSPLAGSQGKLSSEGLLLDFVPAALLRRCSPFARSSLAVAHAAAHGGPPGLIDMPTVFASAHGESGVTEQLLQEIARETPLSPMGFSLSVHNAASGVFSIATGNKAPASAVAANEDTFVMGLCEAALQLSEQGHERVLYVCSDDLVPEVFVRSAEGRGVPHALAMLLAQPLEAQQQLGQQGAVVTMVRDLEAASESDEALPAAIACARWLAADARGPLSVRAAQGSWRLDAEGATAALFQPAVKAKAKESGA